MRPRLWKPAGTSGSREVATAALTDSAEHARNLELANAWQNQRRLLANKFHEMHVTPKVDLPVAELTAVEMQARINYCEIYDRLLAAHNQLESGKPNPVLVSAFAALAAKQTTYDEAAATLPDPTDPNFLESLNLYELGDVLNAFGSHVAAAFDGKNARQNFETEFANYSVDAESIGQYTRYSIKNFGNGIMNEPPIPDERRQLFILSDGMLGYSLREGTVSSYPHSDSSRIQDPRAVLQLAESMIA